MKRFSYQKRRPQTQNSKNIFEFEKLECRALLAGVVSVGIFEGSLYIRGDAQANQVEINLAAESSEELVVGMAGTSVELWGTLAGNKRFDRVGIRMGDGDDQVIIDGSNTLVTNDLFIDLESGHDLVTVVADPDARLIVRDDLALFGGDGEDSLFVANTYVRDNAVLVGNEQVDRLLVENLQVFDHTTIFGGTGDDSVLVSNSRFANNLGIRGEGNDDHFGLKSNIIRGRFGCFGGADSDLLFKEKNYSNFPSRTTDFETISDTPNQDNAADKTIRPTFEFLNQIESQLNRNTANHIHDAMIKVGDAFEFDLIQLELDASSQTVSVNDPTPSISVRWDQAVQNAVENTGPGPTIASRAYSMVHTAIYDAWSAYDATAISTQRGDDLQQDTSQNTEKNKIEAMSFAAYFVLEDLFESETATFDLLMDELGFDPADVSSDPNSPSAIGKAMSDAVLDFRHDDGSNQLGDAPQGDGSEYSDTSGYTSQNSTGNPEKIDAWTPEYVPIDSEPGTEDRIQEFLTPHWGDVQSFSLESGDQFRPDAPQPFLLVDGTVDLTAKTITLASGEVLSINKSLIGTVINPEFIAQAEEVVEISANLTDQEKLIAEFWEDGGGTSFPPGTFMTFGQFVSARDNHSIDDDAKMFFALGNAVFDAGIATWEAKVAYDYVRPVRAIRELGELGLIGDYDENLGGYAIRAWTPARGTGTILASEFLTYQTPGSDPSPPFAEYTSGHSAFSAAAATILQLFTNRDEFGASVTFDIGESRFEPGSTPSSDVTLYWSTFSDAADEAGLSRLYGGIHFTEGDLNGRELGRNVGNSVWQMAQSYINGTG